MVASIRLNLIQVSAGPRRRKGDVHRSVVPNAIYKVADLELLILF